MYLVCWHAVVWVTYTMIYPFMTICVDSSFLLLWIKLLWTFLYMSLVPISTSQQTRNFICLLRNFTISSLYCVHAHTHAHTHTILHTLLDYGIDKKCRGTWYNTKQHMSMYMQDRCLCIGYHLLSSFQIVLTSFVLLDTMLYYSRFIHNVPNWAWTSNCSSSHYSSELM